MEDVVGFAAEQDGNIAKLVLDPIPNTYKDREKQCACKKNSAHNKDFYLRS